MFIQIRKLLRQREDPVHLTGQLDFSGWDFPGYEIPAAVVCEVDAIPEGGAVRVQLWADAEAESHCGRCLAPAKQPLNVDREYLLRAEDLDEEFPELPLTADGRLDVTELVYQELLFEAPQVLLCSEDCKGLCQRCGKPVAECGCESEPQGDPRLQILRQLLTESE